MPKKPDILLLPPALRRRAEASLRNSGKRPVKPGVPQPQAEPSRMLHELEVHQIELEMQNEELRKTRDAMETGLEKYSDLYDFAPIGYLTLNPAGNVIEANLAAASLLGTHRSALAGRRFSDFVSSPDRAGCIAFLQQVFRRKTKGEYDARLQPTGKTPVDVQMRAIMAHSGKECRVALADVTEHKRAELDISKKARLLDLSHDAIIVRDMEGRILYWNHGAEELYGWSREEALGKISHRLLKTEFLTPLKEMIAELYRTERWTGELIHVNRAGQRITVLARKTLDRDSAGKPIAVLENITDITTRKQAEEKVRVSEVRYRRLFEAAHDGVLLLDPVTRKITDANPFMTKLLGYSQAQLVGKELYEIGLLQDEASSQEMFRKLKRQHEVRYEDLPLESRGGRHQEVEVVANLYQEDGHAVIQCNIRDITVRKMAAQALQASEERYRILFESGPVAVYSCDASGTIQNFNRRAVELWGRSPKLKDSSDKFCGSVKMFRPDGSHIPHQKCPMAAVLRGKFAEVKDGEVIVEQPGGARLTCIVNIRPLKNEAGEITGAINCFYDITERKRIEETLHRVEVLAASNTKLEAEIIRRETVENALQKSQTKQSQLLEETRRMHQQMQQLSRQVLQAQETERKRISRELHDVIVQTLTGINVQLTSLRKDASHDIKGLDRNIARTQLLVEKSVASVHRFARELRPFALDDLGLIPALHTYMKDFAARTGVQTHLTAFAAVEQLNSHKRTILFRVVQEALVNVGKHAQASKVEVNITKLQGTVHVCIKDDGKSFQVEKVLQAKKGVRLGLLGMRERVEMVGGTLNIESLPGQGTTISGQLPSGKDRSTSLRKIPRD
ncbi:MAG: histidine kinase [Verrucomicrobia bacterium]|jgi:PAS domain S-box-containing protein|nr:histidine kinase [Verrucomicrobiota bacterium]